jgi:uncharacterized protein YndB with AHSA1/START domain
MTQDANTVVVEADIAAAPETVWRAFNEQDLAADWLGRGGMSTEPGERFTIDDQGRKIDCEVLEADPARRLRLGWRESDGGVASEVSFILTPTPAEERTFGSCTDRWWSAWRTRGLRHRARASHSGP